MAVLTGVLATTSLAGAVQAQEESKGLVAFSQSALENEWRVLNSNDMEAAARALAMTSSRRTRVATRPSSSLTSSRCLRDSQTFWSLAPVEYEPLAPVPDMAEFADVPLIVIDRSIPGEPGTGNWISLIEVDFVDHGRQLGEEVVMELEQKNGAPEGKLLHITGITGASTEINMTEGMNEVFADYPGIEIVGVCDGKYQEEPGRTCMENFLQRFGRR